MESSMHGSRKYEMDCQYLNSIFSGNVEVNKEKLVEILTNRNSQEFKLIRQTYSALYHQDVLHVLSGIRSTDPFANVVYLRISEPQERDAGIVRDALFGQRVNLSILIDVVCTRSSSDLHSIKQTYRLRYNSDIEQDISAKVSSSYKEILLAVLRSSRKYGNRVDMSMALCDAKTLYEAIECGNSVDWKTILTLIGERNTGHIKAILVSYKELYGHEFSKFLKCNKCGIFGKDLRVVIRGIQYPEKFLAKQIRGAWQNGDVREVLPRILITRVDVDIKDISNAFATKTGNSIDNLVRREFSSRSGDKTCGFVAEFLQRLLKTLVSLR